MASSSADSATNFSVPRISEFRVLANPAAAVTRTHTATSCFGNLLLSSRRIVGSEISIIYFEATAIDLQFTIWEPNVCNNIFSSDLHATWARHSKLNVIQDVLKHHSAPKEQSLGDQLYCLGNKCVRLLNIRYIQNAFVANEQKIFQVPAALPCDYFAVANFHSVRFADVYTSWILEVEAVKANALVPHY